MSSEDPFGRSEVTKKFRELLRKAMEIQKSHQAIEENSVSLMKGFSAEKQKALSSLYDNSNNNIATEQKRLLELFQYVDDLIIERQNAAPSLEVPAVSQLKEAFLDFVSSPLPLKQSPYAPLCGSLPFPPDRIIPPKSFVCAPHNDMFILAYVIGFDPETLSYHVCDVDPEDGISKSLTVKAADITPMPTSAPSRRTKSTNFPLRSRVFSLWPDDAGGWTSVFYPATVASIPTTSPGWYRLKFDGEPTVFGDVPEKFVIKPQSLLD